LKLGFKIRKWGMEARTGGGAHRVETKNDNTSEIGVTRMAVAPGKSGGRIPKRFFYEAPPTGENFGLLWRSRASKHSI
jgi:hypothetical protein